MMSYCGRCVKISTDVLAYLSEYGKPPISLVEVGGIQDSLDFVHAHGGGIVYLRESVTFGKVTGAEAVPPEEPVP